MCGGGLVYTPSRADLAFFQGTQSFQMLAMPGPKLRADFFVPLRPELTVASPVLKFGQWKTYVMEPGVTSPIQAAGSDE